MDMRSRRLHELGLTLILAAGLAASANAADLPLPPKVAPPPIAVSVKDQQLKSTLAVEKLKIGMLQGDELGYSSGGWFCNGRHVVTVSDAFINNYGAAITAIVTQELKRLNYPLASGGNASAFDRDIAAAPDFRLGGIVKEAKFEQCYEMPVPNSSEGWIYFKIDWALYSERLQKVVYQATTEGLSVSKDKIPDLSKRAINASLANFLTAPEFQQALQAPAQPAAETAGDSTSASGAAAGAGASGMSITAAAPQPGGAMKNQARLRAAVVTLETAAGTGSGFYIDRDGHLLTNAHVVSGAKFAKVKLQNGDKLVAEVVKVNEQTDVALLKTPSVDLDPLVPRASALDVGEDVYAIGSPLGVLTNSMTRGVLSADRTLQGKHLLQSDAAVTFGSSGGPLLDSDGRVIAITKAGIDAGKGFNFFIPILDALKAVDVGLK